MRPKKQQTTGSNDLFRARLDQIINLKHELVLLAGKIDWNWIDGEIAPLYSEHGRPGIATRFMIGLLLLKHIYGLSDEGVCERWVHDPYFQYFTGEKVRWLVARQLQDSAAVVVVISFDRAEKDSTAGSPHHYRSFIGWQRCVTSVILFRPKAAGRQLAYVPIGAPTTFRGLAAPLPHFGFTPDGGHRPSPD